jgi:hypothetical protein
MVWVFQLPAGVQRELREDARQILQRLECCEDIEDALDRVMCEKLVNVIGDEDGLLPAEKYGKYIWI